MLDEATCLQGVRSKELKLKPAVLPASSLWKNLRVSFDASHKRLCCSQSRPERVGEDKTPSCFGNVKSVSQPALHKISHLVKGFQITTSYDI